MRKMWNIVVNALILLHFRKTIRRCVEVVQDPKSEKSRQIGENFTMEELEGCTDLERIGRIMELPNRTLWAEMKHMRERVAKLN